MAIDYNAAIIVVDQIQAKLQDMRSSLLAIKRPWVKVGNITISFSTDQKTAIEKMHTSLRDEIIKLVEQLPEVKG